MRDVKSATEEVGVNWARVLQNVSPEMREYALNSLTTNANLHRNAVELPHHVHIGDALSAGNEPCFKAFRDWYDRIRPHLDPSTFVINQMGGCSKIVMFRDSDRATELRHMFMRSLDRDRLPYHVTVSWHPKFAVDMDPGTNTGIFVEERNPVRERFEQWRGEVFSSLDPNSVQIYPSRGGVRYTYKHNTEWTVMFEREEDANGLRQYLQKSDNK